MGGLLRLALFKIVEYAINLPDRKVAKEVYLAESNQSLMDAAFLEVFPPPHRGLGPFATGF